MKKIITFLLVSLLVSNSILAKALSLAPANDSIQLTGMVFSNQDRVKGVVIKIYSNNLLIKTVKVRSSNRFKTNLPINSELTIEIWAPEHHAKRFIFDSHIPADLTIIPKYQFDIDIFKEKELEGVNTSILDFPVGLVYYDSKKKEFVRNKKYTKRMKKAYLDLWEEAQMSERSGLE